MVLSVPGDAHLDLLRTLTLQALIKALHHVQGLGGSGPLWDMLCRRNRGVLTETGAILNGSGSSGPSHQ